METTKIRFLKELELYLNDEDVTEDERVFALSLYECISCHWRFYGDVVRFGYGYNSQGQQTPDYCPMCGRKINDEV